MERTMLYLYRGVLIHWYLSTSAEQACVFTTSWEAGDRWHWSGAYTDLDDALTEACRALDEQLANRPSVISHQSSGRIANIPEPGRWTVDLGR